MTLSSQRQPQRAVSWPFHLGYNRAAHLCTHKETIKFSQLHRVQTVHCTLLWIPALHFHQIPPGNSLIVLAIRVKTKSLWDKKSKLEWLHVLVLLSCSSTKNKFYQWRAESPHYNPDFRGLGQKRSQSRYAPFIVQMWILFCLVFETCLKNAGILKACHHAHHEHVKKHPVPSRSRARSPGIFPKSHGFLWFLILISVWSRNFFPTARES